MSELKNSNIRFGFQEQLLTTASALALGACICAAGAAQADGADHPTIWIELGGQLERVDGTQSRFTAPFDFVTPVPGPYSQVSPIEAQRSPRYAVGGEGKISFEPRGSDWIFSAGVRYGRSNSNKHIHYQTYTVPPLTSPGGLKRTLGILAYVAKFADTKNTQSESHAILDFVAGKEVGLGLFGRDATSVFNVGVRFAQFASKINVALYARPDLTFHNGAPNGLSGFQTKYLPRPSFHFYTQHGRAERSFHGIGPSLSWDASAPFAGNPDNAEFTFDWGINASVLFGRQKASVHHSTTAQASAGKNVYTLLYQTSTNRTRTRHVAIPNVGGFAGISLKFPNAKVSLGYRGDFFFGAMDTGIDAANGATVGFYGPFATVSIGFGG